MALPYKLNFRSTTAFVTDGAGETAAISETNVAGTAGIQYSSQPHNSIAMGWDNATSGTRDRSAVPAVEFAGVHRNETANLATFRIDLPATGSYSIRVAMGDWLQAWTTKIQIFDNTTLLTTLSGTTSGANKYIDATGVERTSDTDWLTNNAAITKTFATTTFFLKLGDGVSVDTGVIAHLEIASAAVASAVQVVGAGVGSGGVIG